MDIKKIKEIVNANLGDEITAKYIFAVISDDREAIPTILNSYKQKENERKSFCWILTLN